MPIDVDAIRFQALRGRAELETQLDDQGRALLDLLLGLERVLARHEGYPLGAGIFMRPVGKDEAARIGLAKSPVRKGATRDQILAILRDGERHKIGDLAKRMKKSVNATSAAVRALRDRGLVNDEGYGWYRLASPNGGAKGESIANPTGLFIPGDGREGGGTVGAVPPPAGAS